MPNQSGRPRVSQTQTRRRGSRRASSAPAGTVRSGRVVAAARRRRRFHSGPLVLRDRGSARGSRDPSAIGPPAAPPGERPEQPEDRERAHGKRPEQGEHQDPRVPRKRVHAPPPGPTGPCAPARWAVRSCASVPGCQFSLAPGTADGTRPKDLDRHGPGDSTGAFAPSTRLGIAASSCRAGVRRKGMIGMLRCPACASFELVAIDPRAPRTAASVTPRAHVTDGAPRTSRREAA